MVSKA